MKKHIIGEFPTKAKKRELKKRPRMPMHGKALLRGGKFAGRKLIVKKP